jgi:hypothetical protein
MSNMNNSVANYEPLNKGFLAIDNLTDALKVADIIASSSFCPKQFAGKRADVLVCMQMGAELGLKPLQALQNIAVINGKPSIWGDAMLALCQQSAHYESIEETFNEDTMTASCKAKRKGSPVAVGEFSKEEAIKAGLWGKNVWASYPKRMLKMRARGFALRDAFADVLRGLISAEEAQDYPTLKTAEKPQVNILERIKEKQNYLQTEEPANTLAGRIGRVITSFAEINVSVENLEAKLGHNINVTDENELAELYNVYKAIKNNTATRADFFEIAAPLPTSTAADTIQNLLQFKAAPDAAKTQNWLQNLAVDPETGEVLPPELQ